MIIDNRTLSEGELLEILQRSSQDFSPPLDEAIDIEHYAQKWSSLAHFITANERNEVVGLVVYYLNIESIYIAHLWVAKSQQRKGIGRELLNKLVEQYKDKTQCIMLEVIKSNDRAQAFYAKNGFFVSEDRGKKFLLVKGFCYHE